MEESKAKKLIVSCTVGAVLLGVILLIVMIYQLIAIGVKNNRIDYYKEQLAILDQRIAESENDLEAKMERDWIIYEARKLGYHFDGDNSLG